MAFKSSGAAAARAIREIVLQEEARILAEEERERRRQLDAEEREDRTRTRKREDRLDTRQIAMEAMADADRLAKLHAPDTDVDPEIAKALAAGGYSVSRPFESTTRVSPIASTLPGADAAPDELMQSPYGQREATYFEKLAAAELDREQAAKAEDRAFRDSQARATEAFRREESAATRAANKERYDSDRELKEMIAAAQAGNTATSRALADELRRIQIAQAEEKLEGTRRERRDVTTAVAASRSELRELAQGLIDDPALDEITGSIEGRRSTFVKGRNVDALRRLEQVVNKLSLESRSKLKGQGAISDSETKMLANAVAAIDRAAGPEIVRKHLKAIVDAFAGDAPGAGGSDDGRYVVTVE